MGRSIGLLPPTRHVGSLFLLALLACGGDSGGRSAPVVDQPGAIVERSLPAGPITGDLFGINFVAMWASPAALPGGVTLLRLHDASPRWHALHTGPGQWDSAGLARIDAVLLFADRFAPGAQTLYVIAGGPFPDWPDDIAAAFRAHVRFLAERYAGRIDVWEIWNEPDSRQWFTGSTVLLMELTVIAADEIRAADPDALVAGPSFTESGIAMMRDFYRLLPAGTVDIVAWHHGVVSPERDTTAIREAKRIAGGLPLWLTEWNTRGGAGELMRTLLVHHLYGVEAAAYYSFEMASYGVPGTFAHTSNADGSLTEAGAAFLTLREWLVGRTVVDWSVSGDAWSVTLDSGHVITWNATAGNMPVLR